MFLGRQTFHWSGVLQDIPDHLPANRHRRRVQDDQQDRHYLRLQIDRVPQREAEGRQAQPDPLPGVRPEEGDCPQHLFVQKEALNLITRLWRSSPSTSQTRQT